METSSLSVTIQVPFIVMMKVMMTMMMMMMMG